MDEYDNSKRSERIQAGEVRAGDVIAAAANLTHLFIEPDQFRTVRFVEPAAPNAEDYRPDVEQVRIGWTSARGADHVQTYPADAMFHRLPERPELPPMPGPQPEGLTDTEYNRLRSDQDTYARVCVDYLLTPGKSKDAREMARRSKKAEAAYQAEMDRRADASLRELIERETNGTTTDRDRPIRAGWTSFGVNREDPEPAPEDVSK
jgi:hypothetical protein